MSSGTLLKKITHKLSRAKKCDKREKNGGNKADSRLISQKPDSVFVGFEISK